MNSRFIIPLLVIGALAFACGPRPHTEASTPPAATAATKSAPKRAKQTKPVMIDPAIAITKRADGAVSVVLHVANAGKKNVELAFPSGQTHDVAVLDEQGREVWRWSEGKLFTQSFQTKMLGSGDTVTFDESWSAKNVHGRFVAVATLKSSNFPVEQRVEFVIP
jgi:hypothetical protein